MEDGVLRVVIGEVIVALSPRPDLRGAVCWVSTVRNHWLSLSAAYGVAYRHWLIQSRTDGGAPGVVRCAALSYQAVGDHAPAPDRRKDPPM